MVPTLYFTAILVPLKQDKTEIWFYVLLKWSVWLSRQVYIASNSSILSSTLQPTDATFCSPILELKLMWPLYLDQNIATKDRWANPLVIYSVTRSGDLFDFGQLFTAFGNN